MEINDILQKTSVLLPTRCAASGLAVNETEYAIVDGITSFVYIFSFCGMYKGAVPTMRPYRKIVHNHEKNIYYALDSCSSIVYLLNDRFEETDILSHRINAKIIDISFSEGKLFLVLPHAIYSNCDSTPELVSSDCNIFFQCFARCEKIYAGAFFESNNGQLVISNGESKIFNCLPTSVSIKTIFTTDGGGIYGFFGKNYVNNYIIPIYENQNVNFSNLYEFLCVKQSV